MGRTTVSLARLPPRQEDDTPPGLASRSANLVGDGKMKTEVPPALVDRLERDQAKQSTTTVQISDKFGRLKWMLLHHHGYEGGEGELARLQQLPYLCKGSSRTVVVLRKNACTA